MEWSSALEGMLATRDAHQAYPRQKRGRGCARGTLPGLFDAQEIFPLPKDGPTRSSRSSFCFAALVLSDVVKLATSSSCLSG